MATVLCRQSALTNRAMPNAVALLVLALWPFVVIALHGRLSTDRALILSLLVGYMFLPEYPTQFDLPLLPALNKHNIPALTAFVVTLWRSGRQTPLLPESRLGRVLLVVFILTPIMTVLTNGETVFYGQVGLPAMGLKELISLPLQQFFLIVPFLLARQHLAHGSAQRELLKALVVGALVYSLFMLVEIRLSPQMNQWVYGFYQHSFAQTLRGGGYRPVVFMYHGIWVAFFVMTAIVASWALWRQAYGGARFQLQLIALYLMVILVLAKSLGALLFMLLLVPLVVLVPNRLQVKIALVIGVFALSYPLMKGLGIFPTEKLTGLANSFDPARAQSLQFRFDNENTLLTRALHKPFFGWGSWGRNHVLDSISGRVLTITDGRWVITIGVYGWIGFLAEFGLLVLPLFLLWQESRHTNDIQVSPFVGALSLILAINVLDLLPNATLTPLTWLVAGMLTGYAEELRRMRLKTQRPTQQGLAWKSVM